jgi:hypothetical protein
MSTLSQFLSGCKSQSEVFTSGPGAAGGVAASANTGGGGGGGAINAAGGNGGSGYIMITWVG